MSPSNLREQLPIVKSLLKWFVKEDVYIDSFAFKLHHQVTSLIILIGFTFTVVENYLDAKVITCMGKEYNKYAQAYCWIHGTSYVAKHLQKHATGCYVDHDKIKGESRSTEDILITAYYLWLPYLMSFNFMLCKLPHTLWKRYFENGLIKDILGYGGVGKQNESEGNNQDEDKACDDGDDSKHNKSKKNKQKSNKKKASLERIAANFINQRKKYKSYQLNFFWLETLNIVTLLASVQVTHWLLNYKFWNYGTEVTAYLTMYGEYQLKGLNLHDPMCELFPTEVSCNLIIGSPTGSVDKNNFLCILQNNIFNQKYFYILWMWWITLLTFSIINLIYRMMLMSSSFFAQMMLSYIDGEYKKTFKQLNSADCFVIQLVIQNLSSNSIDNFMQEVANKLEQCENSVRLTNDVENGLQNEP